MCDFHFLNNITKNIKKSDLVKFREHYKTLSSEEQDKLIQELQEKSANNLTKNEGSVVGIISQHCSSLEQGGLMYYFNLQGSKKLFIYYIKSDEEEKIFEEGNIISVEVHTENNSYVVDSITLKAKFEA